MNERMGHAPVVDKTTQEPTRRGQGADSRQDSGLRFPLRLGFAESSCEVVSANNHCIFIKRHTFSVVLDSGNKHFTYRGAEGSADGN
jgi:hypothetical protein